MSVNLSTLNDKHKSLLADLGYANLPGNWKEYTCIIKLLKASDRANLAEEFERHGLEYLTIVAYEDDNHRTGFCGIVFEDSYGARGFSIRGTEGLDDFLNDPIDMLDNIAASLFGASPQKIAGHKFYHKYKNEDGNNFLYAHSKGFNISLDIFIENYNEIQKVHGINGQPINIKKLRLDQIIALRLKVDAVIIDGDVVGLLGFPGYKVRYIKNIGEQGFFKPHDITSAAFDDDGYYIEIESLFPYVSNYLGQGAFVIIAAPVIDAIRSTLAPHSRYLSIFDGTAFGDIAIIPVAIGISAAAAIATLVVDLIETIKDFSTTISMGFKHIGSGIADIFKGIVSLNLAQILVGGVFKLIYGIVLVIWSPISLIINCIIDMINLLINIVMGIINGMSRIAEAAGGLVGQDWGWHFNVSPIPKIKPPSISLFENGGFPSTGQMFIAREAGPELVGMVDGCNAVVNNDQIVEAVKRGVYRAFMSALCENNSKIPAIARVFLDGKQIAIAQQV